jgi:hypothetical protein
MACCPLQPVKLECKAALEDIEEVHPSEHEHSLAVKLRSSRELTLHIGEKWDVLRWVQLFRRAMNEVRVEILPFGITNF